MISTDISRPFFKNTHKIGTDGSDGLVYFFRRDQEILDGDTVKFFCIHTNSRVSILFDIR